MRNDEKAENQHYVPKMLLRNFCIPGKEQIHVYDKWEKRSFYTNIDNVSCERNHNVVGEGEERINAEPLLTFLENEALTAINKIFEHKKLSVLSEKDEIALSSFIAAQYFRTRHTKENYKKINQVMAKKIRAMGFDPADVQGFKEFDDDGLKRLSLEMLESIPEMALHLKHKEWLLLKTQADAPFYISDNPVGFHNNNDYGPYGNLGFAVPGIQIFCPISSTLTLGMFCHSILGEAHKIQRENDSRMREQKALSILGATSQMREKAASFVRTMTSLADKNPRLKAFMHLHQQSEKGEPINQNADNLVFQNYIQVRFSHRYVYSSNDNFDLVERILKDHPDWKMGLMIQV